MWNFEQDFGIGMTKKNTPYQAYDVEISRKEYPYWYWKQSYTDEIQVREDVWSVKSQELILRHRFDHPIGIRYYYIMNYSIMQNSQQNSRVPN